MINKRLFLVLLAFTLIISLGTIAATDNNNDTTSIEKTTTSTSETSLKTPEPTKNIKKQSKPVKEATQSVTSYTELYNNLTSPAADEDTTITLAGEEETYTITDTIKVSETIKNLVIEGNGKTIDGKNQYQFLNVSKICNLTLNNLTIKNCFSEEMEGGAIYYNANSNLVINNTKFIENGFNEENYDYRGGAVHIKNATASIYNSNFTSNCASKGSAIYYSDNNGNNLTIKNTTFYNNGYWKNNPVSDETVTIITNSTVYIDENKFLNNTYTTSGININGGNNTNIVVNNSLFEDNGYQITDTQTKYSDKYGAIFLDIKGNTTIDNSTFKNNIAREGGAISFSDINSLSILNSEFTDNTAEDGGAIGGTSTKSMLLENSTFKNNGRFISEIMTNDRYAGVLQIEDCENITVNKCNFTENNPTHYGVFVIEGSENINISNSNFINNNATSYSVAFLSVSKNINIDNCNFTNNTDQDDYDRGAVLYLVADGNVTITANNFINNSAYINNGILYLFAYGEEANITNNNFIKNYVEDGCTALYVYFEPSDENKIVYMDNLTFESNRGGEYSREGALVLEGYSKYDYSTGKTIYYGSYKITNSRFIDNCASSGGALTIDAKVEINNTNFTGNYIDWSDFEGGAICNDGYLTLNYTNFDDNKALSESKAGCIYNAGTLIIDNTNITNTFSNEEGAIYHDGTLLIVNHTNFKNNRADSSDSSYGGAICSYGENAFIDNSYFINNSVSCTSNYGDYMGGAIYTNDKINLTNSVFIENTPANFIIKDGIIQLNKTKSGEIRNDGHIPSDANMTIYVNNQTEVTGRHLKENRVDDFNPSNDDFLYRLVLNASDSPSYIESNGWFHNNTYYISIAHDYILSVKVKDVIWNETANITGKLYYLDSEDKEVCISNQEIELYINDTYITSNTTNEDGEYSFKYLAEVIGKQDVKVRFAGNSFIEEITNKTSFNVNQEDTKISLEATNCTIGEKYVITGNLTDINDNPLYNVDIKLYINNIKHDIHIDEGKINYEDTALLIGENHVFAVFDGNYVYSNSYNITTFNVNELKTSLTVTATNTTINNETTIKVKLVDGKNNNVTGANVIIYVNEEMLNDYTTDNHGEIEFKYPASIPGINYVEVYYKGNRTYNSSINSTTFTAYKKNSNITIGKISSKVGNLSYNVRVTDDEKNPITNGTIVVYDENNKAILTKSIDGIETELIIKDITSGTYTFNITYTGNNTYNPSSSIQTVTILPEARIDINVINNTEGNVQIQINVTDDKGNPVTEDVKVTLPDGTTTTLTPNPEGIISITDTTTPAGETSITVEVPTTSQIEGTTKTETITIEPDYQKIIDELKETIKDMNDTIQDLNNTIQEQKQTIEDMNNTIQDLNNTVQEQKQTIDNMNKTIKDLNNTVQEQKQTIDNMNKTIKDLNNTVKEQKKTIKDLNNKVNNLTKTIDQLEDTIDGLQKEVKDLKDTINTRNKTSTMKVVPENGTVDNNNVIVTLENKLSDPIANAPVKVVNSAGESIGTGKTDKEGIAVIPVSTKAGTEKVTVVYAGDKKHTPVNKTVSVTTSKNNVTLTVDPVEGIVGENIKLTAHIKDTNGKAVSGGNLVFKLNGKTLRTDGSFNSTAPAWKFKVNNGKVTVTIKADLYLRNVKNLTASYSGTYKYEEAKSDTVTAQIKKRNAQISVKTSPKMQKQYKTIMFTASVKDTTPNTKNKTAINMGTSTIFKINGKTIKDKNDKNLMVPVKNGTAIYKYTVPQAMAGVTKTGDVRDYIVEAVLVSDTFYPDTRAETSFNVERSPVTINIGRVTIGNNRLSIKADIKDYMNKQLVGNSTVAIKINGKTYLNSSTGEPEVFTVENGKINLKNLRVSGDITIKKVMIVTGARQAYLGGRNETSNIVKT